MAQQQLRYDPDDNATVRAAKREWVEYENDEGATVVAHRVTPDTGGKVRTVGGQGAHYARPGDVLVQTQNSNLYDVYSSRVFDEMFPRRADGVEEERVYEPSGYTAREVREHLLSIRDDDPDEYDRIVEAERAGRGRATAIPK